MTIWSNETWYTGASNLYPPPRILRVITPRKSRVVDSRRNPQPAGRGSPINEPGHIRPRTTPPNTTVPPEVFLG